MKDTKHRLPSVSIFFPFLNDWGTVGSLVELAVSTVSQLTDDWEVIIIDDGSKKEDREALESIVNLMNFKRHSGLSRISKIKTPRGWQAERSEAMTPPMVKGLVRIITHEKNRGYGGALRSGFDNATKDLIFYTDCDAQYDPRELKLLYGKMKPAFSRLKVGIRRSEIGMVNGYKIKRQDPLIRIIVGRLYHYIVKFAFGLPIRDTDCDFRLIRKNIFKKVKLFENTGTICVELVKKIDRAGYKIVEVPVHHYYRTSGKSQFFNFPRLFKTGVNLLKLWWKLIIKKEYSC